MRGSTIHLWLEHLALAEASDRGQAVIIALAREGVPADPCCGGPRSSPRTSSRRRAREQRGRRGCGDRPGAIGPQAGRCLQAFWSVPAAALMTHLQNTPRGLSSEVARQRLSGAASQRPGAGRITQVLMLLLAQFRSPIILTLLVAATLSFSLRDATDALIILAIVLISGLLGFWQEWGAADAVAKLLALVQVRATVLREDRPVEVPVEQVVPGDVVVLDAGDVIPGDGRILEARDLFVSEATLTGETFPVEKGVGLVPPDAPLARRTNCLYLGTSVVSGTARLLVVHTGRQTESRGAAAPAAGDRVRARHPPLRLPAAGGHPPAGLGRLAINVVLHRPVLESLLFALQCRRSGLGFGDWPRSGRVTCASRNEDLAAGPAARSSTRPAACGPRCRRSAERTLDRRSWPSIWTSPATRSSTRSPTTSSASGSACWSTRDGRHRIITKGALAGILEVCSTAEAGDGRSGRVLRPAAADRAAIRRVQRPGLPGAGGRLRGCRGRDRHRQGP